MIPLPRPSTTTTTDHNSLLAHAAAGTTRQRSPTLRGGLSTSVSKSVSPVRLRSEHSLLPLTASHNATDKTSPSSITDRTIYNVNNNTDSDVVLPFETSFPPNTASVSAAHSSTSSAISSSGSSSFLKRGASFGFHALKAMVSEKKGYVFYLYIFLHIHLYLIVLYSWT